MSQSIRIDRLLVAATGERLAVIGVIVVFTAAALIAASSPLRTPTDRDPDR